MRGTLGSNGAVVRRKPQALGYLALVALAVLVRLALPVGIGLFLGALLGFTLESPYERLRRRRVAPGPAALVCSLGATLTVFAALIGLVTLLATRGAALLVALREQLVPGTAFRAFLDHVAARLTSLHIDVPAIEAKAEDAALSVGSQFASAAARAAGLAFTMLLALLFVAMSAYTVLRHWAAIRRRAELLLPFERRHTLALLDQFRTVGRQVLLGTVVAGLVQGVLGAIGYALTGVPEPAFFGALTAIASLVPGIGTALVWATIGVVRMLSGHLAAGLAEIVYGALAVGVLVDYVVRPRLVGNSHGVPAIVTFIALFGGVEAFGVVGLVLGPVIATLSWAILQTYAKEAGAVARPEDAASPS
jgi:predicted PurR-regulated permease PerM